MSVSTKLCGSNSAFASGAKMKKGGERCQFRLWLLHSPSLPHLPLPSNFISIPFCLLPPSVPISISLCTDDVLSKLWSGSDKRLSISPKKFPLSVTPLHDYATREHAISEQNPVDSMCALVGEDMCGYMREGSSTMS